MGGVDGRHPHARLRLQKAPLPGELAEVAFVLHPIVVAMEGPAVFHISESTFLSTQHHLLKSHDISLAASFPFTTPAPARHTRPLGVLFSSHSLLGDLTHRILYF